MMTMAHAQELISGSDRFRGVSRTCLHICVGFCRLLSSFVLALCDPMAVDASKA